MTSEMHRVFPAAIAIALAFASRPVLAEPNKDECIDANGKGQNLRREGKLAAAADQYRQCAAQSCPAIVRDDCAKRLAAIEEAQPTIIFEARDATGNDVSAVKVTMDGLPLTDQLKGTPLSIDPGQHTFTFEVAGQPILQRQFVIRESEKDRRERITLGATEPGPRREPSKASPPVAPPPGATGAPEASAGLGTQKILAIVAGSIGLVGLGAGTVFGVLTISERNDARRICAALCPTPQGVSEWSNAKTTATVSTAAFVVGGVALAGGAALWFSAKTGSGSGSSAGIGIGPGAVELKGVW